MIKQFKAFTTEAAVNSEPSTGSSVKLGTNYFKTPF